MLRITVDVVPFGNARQKHTLGVMEISNQRTWDSGHADYLVKEGGKVWEIRGFDRAQGYWALIEEARRVSNLLTGGKS